MALTKRQGFTAYGDLPLPANAGEGHITASI